MRKILLIIVGTLIFFVIIAVVIDYIPRITCKGTAWECERETKEPSVVQKGESKTDYYTYYGKNGRTAYDILMKDEKAWVGAQDAQVTSINFRKADASKNEHWVMYSNGIPIETKPWEYMTKDTDLIEWKIER